MVMNMRQPKIRTYSELIQLPTLEERYLYLKIGGKVGEETFGYDRYINQMLYKMPEWEAARRDVIIRDKGNDLGLEGYEISGNIYVHHMNPITADDIINRLDYVLDPEYLISSSFNTHQAIHYGNEDLLPQEPIERFKNDTCPWKQVKRKE